MLNNDFLEEEIIDIYHEKHPNPEYQWDSGILRVKVKVKNTTESKQKIESMPNKIQLCLIDENKTVCEHGVTIIRAGAKTCNHCGESGHLRVNRPRSSEKCSNCGSQKHYISKCPLSR